MIASPVRTFGKYLLDEEIARGGMSRVYLARLRGLGGFEKKLVVKQVLPELASDPRFVSMFVQEAKTLVQMSHPHIAPVYELGVVDGVYFLAMEYVDGGTLSQILKSGPLAPELVAHMGAQICDALHYAHERFEIIHRDVTPRNVIVDTEGHARLLDFGIATPASDEEGELFGTPGYLSPEQASGGALGPASDVFSLGAVLFEALTARRAFFARNVEEAREVLTMDGPDFYPDDLVPEALAKIVQRALVRDPAERYTSARKLGKALRSWVAAHAPEGVGPELAVRARDVESEAPSVEEVLDEVADEPAHESEIKTLATSRLLDELLGPAIEPPTSPVDGSDEPGTTRIERESEPEEPGTKRIERASQPEAVADPGEDEDGGEPEEEGRSIHDEETIDLPVNVVAPREVATPISSTARLVLGVAALLIVGAVAWAAWSPDEIEPHDPVIETPPDVEGPTDIEDPIEDPLALMDAAADEEDAGVEALDAAAETETTPPVQPPDTPPLPRGNATLSVNAIPWAEVTINGRSRGRTPLRSLPIRAGQAYTIVFENPDLGRTTRTTVVAEPGQRITSVADLNTANGSVQNSRTPASN